MEKDKKRFNAEVSNCLKITNKESLLIDKDELAVMEKLIKLDMFSVMILIFITLKSIDMRLRGIRSRMFFENKVFRSIRRSSEFYTSFVLPFSYCTATWFMLALIRQDLHNTWKNKYFLTPHMRFEVNTGRRLELYEDPA